MEIIFNKYILKGSFKIFKNYTLLCDKTILTTKDFFRFNGDYFYLYPKEKKNNTNYFYSDNDKIYVRLNGFKTITTYDKKKINKYFNKPFISSYIEDLYVNIYKSEDKLTLKLFKKELAKSVNTKFYKKNIYEFGVTFYLKNGNIRTFSKFNKKIGFRTNNFNDVFSVFYRVSNELKINNKYEEYNNILEIFNKNLNINITDNNDLEKNILSFFINKKQIKVNNDYSHYLCNYYPTEKYLKKNGRKLILSILDKYNIKSKSTIKLLHNNNKINLDTLKKLCDILGNNYYKYINLVNPIFFNKNFTSQKHKDFILSDNEKNNIVEIINDYTLNTSYDYDIFNSFIDHFDMIEKIKDYFDVKLTSKTFNSFSNDHIELSKKLNFVKKGTSILYIFTQKVVDDIETPVNMFDKTFYPVILKREEEYTDEGIYMHHCVGTYADRDNSMIISIRTDDDRVTCEFNTQTGKLIQSRHFFNKEPSDEMKVIVDLINIKTFKWARLGLLHNKEKKLVPPIINGVEVKKLDREFRTFNDVL